MSQPYPDDAVCDWTGENGERCGHPFGHHETVCATLCDDCHDGIFEHAFRPRRFAGGTFSPSAEKAAYERALRGEL